MAFLIHLDDACAQHLQHGAMAGSDPLTDALYSQLEGPAEEGAQPARTAGTGLTPQQWRAMAESHREGGRGWAWVAGALLAVACALMQVYPMGWAA